MTVDKPLIHMDHNCILCVYLDFFNECVTFDGVFLGDVGQHVSMLNCVMKQLEI